MLQKRRGGALARLLFSLPRSAATKLFNEIMISD
jgi:hypothetical protein